MRGLVAPRRRSAFGKFKRIAGLSLAASAFTDCGGTEGRKSPDETSTLEDIEKISSAPDADTADTGAVMGFHEGNLPDICAPVAQAPEITTYAAKLSTAPEQVAYSGPSTIGPPEVNQAYSESYLSEPKDVARFSNLSGIAGNDIIHGGGGDNVSLA